LLQKLIELMAQGGIGVIHLTFADTRSPLRRAALALRVRSRLVHGVFNKIRRRSFPWPLMQMNNYSINRIFNMLIDLHCSNGQMEFTDHGGFRGAMLYFERKAG
jgi:hypothetical protein